MNDSQKDILDFWFDQTSPQQWFQTNPEFDALVAERFLERYEKARDGVFDDWRRDADGCLALCLLMDQFPRNMFRGTPQAYATDSKALVIAKYAVSKGFDQVLPLVKRRFLYLPYEHSETLNDQRCCVEFFEKIKKEDPLSYDYALRHFQVIDEYGRFPHRNKILGRMNTPEEEEYLARPDSGF